MGAFDPLALAAARLGTALIGRLQPARASLYSFDLWLEPWLRRFGPEPVRIALGALSEAELQVLIAEPALSVVTPDVEPE